MATLQKTSPGRYVMKDLYLFTCKRDTLEQKLQSLPIQIPLILNPFPLPMSMCHFGPQ